MIYVFCALAVILGLFLILVGQAKDFARERKAWTEERSELLSRIQRPDHLPVAPRPDFMVPERELDEWNRVGQIVIDPEYGLDD